MRILLVGAGASISTKDVEVGLYDALREAGHDVKLYALERRIEIAWRWLRTIWRAQDRPPDRQPVWADAIYRASVEALEMALRFDVDWTLVVSAMFFHPDVLEMMRRSGLRTGVIFTESPYQDEQQARVAHLATVCWTNERISVSFLSQFNPRTAYLRHAYDPKRHSPIAEVDATVPSHDVVFVGTGWRERIDLLSAIDWTGIDFGLYGAWPMLGSRHRLRKYLRAGPIDNRQTAALYRQARIGLNLHRRHEHAQSMNPRAYELAACGVFHLSDARREVVETFGHTVPTFAGPEQLEALLRAYLANEPARHALAQEARHRIEPHTFAARAAQLVADLDEIEARPQARGA